jgi:hypothetical protein
MTHETLVISVIDWWRCSTQSSHKELVCLSPPAYRVANGSLQRELFLEPKQLPNTSHGFHNTLLYSDITHLILLVARFHCVLIRKMFHCGKLLTYALECLGLSDTSNGAVLELVKRTQMPI